MWQSEVWPALLQGGTVYTHSQDMVLHDRVVAIVRNTFRLKKDCVNSNAEIQMPNECQNPNANEIGWQHPVAIQLHILMVIMVLGFTLPFDSLDFVIPVSPPLAC